MEHDIRIEGEEFEEGETYYFRAVSKVNEETILSSERSFVYFKGDETGLFLAFLGVLGDFFSSPWFWIIILLIIIAWLIYKLSKKRQDYYPTLMNSTRAPNPNAPPAYTNPRLEPNPSGIGDSKTMFML